MTGDQIEVREKLVPSILCIVYCKDREASKESLIVLVQAVILIRKQATKAF